MNRTIEKIGLAALLFFTLLPVQNASAAFTEILPQSSYADGHWQGYRFFNKELQDGVFLSGRLDFAVYDSQNLQLAGETDLVNELDMPGRYIYTYQVFNDLPSSNLDISYLAVFALNGAPLDVHEDSIGSHQDPENGVEPTYADFAESNTKGVWQWELNSGGFVSKDEHSWFLVFCSDSAPVPGTYEIQAPDQGELPVPEPSTIALLGFGGVIILRKQRKTRLVT